MAMLGFAGAETSAWRDSDTLGNFSLVCSPQNRKLHEIFGYSLMERGRAAEAMQHFRKAWELKPDSSTSNFGCALASAALGHLDEACALFSPVPGNLSRLSRGPLLLCRRSSHAGPA